MFLLVLMHCHICGPVCMFCFVSFFCFLLLSVACAAWQACAARSPGCLRMAGTLPFGVSKAIARASPCVSGCRSRARGAGRAKPQGMGAVAVCAKHARSRRRVARARVCGRAASGPAQMSVAVRRDLCAAAPGVDEGARVVERGGLQCVEELPAALFELVLHVRRRWRRLQRLPSLAQRQQWVASALTCSLIVCSVVMLLSCTLFFWLCFVCSPFSVCSGSISSAIACTCWCYGGRWERARARRARRTVRLVGSVVRTTARRTMRREDFAARGFLVRAVDSHHLSITCYHRVN